MHIKLARALAAEMRKYAAAAKKETHRAEAAGKGLLLGSLGAGALQGAGGLALVGGLKPSEAVPNVEKLKAELGRPDIEVRPTDKPREPLFKFEFKPKETPPSRVRPAGETPRPDTFAELDQQIQRLRDRLRSDLPSAASKKGIGSKAKAFEDVFPTGDPGSGWQGSHYSPSKVFGIPTGREEYVTAPTRKGGEFLAHELGHASLRRGGRMARLLGGLSSLRGPLGAAGSLGGMAMAIAPEDPESNVVKAAPLVTAGSWAPTLADEAISSVKGFKALRNTGKYTPEMLRAARGNLLRAFGTYGLAAGATTLPIALASYIRNMRAKEDAAKAGK